MIAIRLTEEIEARLADLTARTGRTKTFYVRRAIEMHLGDLEDLYLAEAELAKVRSARTQPVPLAEVMKMHGLAG